MKGTQIALATLLIGVFLYFDNYLVGNITIEIGEFLFPATLAEKLEGQISTWKAVVVACIVYFALFSLVMGAVAAITKTPKANYAVLPGIALVLKVLQHIGSYFFVSGATFLNIHIAYLIIIALCCAGAKQGATEPEETS